MVTPAIREVEISRDGQPVALCRFGEDPQIAQGDHAEELRHRLEQPRFVRRPDTKAMVWYPTAMDASSPEWWLAHLGDACWPEYDIIIPSTESNGVRGGRNVGGATG